MADIASTDVTVTIVKPQILRGSPGAERRNLVKMVFGDGALTYGTGVPLPAATKFGMVKTVDYMTDVDMGSGSTLTWKWDKANNKLRAYGVVATTVAGAELATNATFAASTIYMQAVGW